MCSQYIYIYRYRKTAKFVLVLVPLFGVIYIASIIMTIANVIGHNIEANIVYLYGEMFYNSFQVSYFKFTSSNVWPIST